MRGTTTFGSLNNIQKLNRMVVADWAHLLDSVPGSRLLLQSKSLVDPGVVGRIRGMFEAFGIPPTRLDLRPASKDFLRTYREIGYDGMIMPDHVPTIEGDTGGQKAFAFCFGYIQALLQTMRAEA